jgi:hypothetical protein
LVFNIVHTNIDCLGFSGYEFADEEKDKTPRSSN